LFGAKKSGKTTLLRAILNLTRITEGTIKFFEQNKLPDDIKVNYMPQSVGLYKKFTVVEIIKYFGKLMGLKSAILNKVNVGKLLYFVSFRNFFFVLSENK
jgi:ABC-2 type transport system ATP-binding protein